MDKKLQKQIDNTEKAISEIKEILIKRFDESDDVAVAVANNVISSMYSYKEPAPPIPSKSSQVKITETAIDTKILHLPTATNFLSSASLLMYFL